MKLKKQTANHLRAEKHILTQQAEEEQNPRLNVDQAARYLGISVSTLNRWRCSHSGPAWIKLGGRVYYHADNLRAFGAGA